MNCRYEFFDAPFFGIGDHQSTREIALEGTEFLLVELVDLRKDPQYMLFRRADLLQVFGDRTVDFQVGVARVDEMDEDLDLLPLRHIGGQVLLPVGLDRLGDFGVSEAGKVDEDGSRLLGVFPVHEGDVKEVDQTRLAGGRRDLGKPLVVGHGIEQRTFAGVGARHEGNFVLKLVLR